jgi:hypothetical protein
MLLTWFLHYQASTLLSRAMFSNALDFRIVENHDFLEFLQYLNPLFKPPTRQAISDKYLPIKEARLQHKVKQHLQKQGSVVLIPDGSSDSCQEHITHVIAVPPDQKPCLLKVLNHHTDKPSAENIAASLKTTITELQKDNITTNGILSDNENKMKNVRSSLLEDNIGLVAAPGR